MTIIQIVEVCDNSRFVTKGNEHAANTPKVFMIDTAKITNEMRRNELRYVQHIVDAALAGTLTMRTHMSTSFTEMPEWYTEIMVPVSATPDVSITVNVFEYGNS